MKIRRLPARSGRFDSVIENFLKRPAFDRTAERVAGRVLADIRKRGARAVLEYVRKYDGVRIDTAEMRVSAREFASARRKVDAGFIKAAREVYGRVSRFAAAGLKKDWCIRTPRGGRVGEVFVPLDRVGVYVPGGKAPLVSTALMTVTLARKAGVKEIVVCTPCGRDGCVDPFLLAAIDIAGATETYRIGGIQAIGMMAYGAGSVRKVQKIAGPGGTFVTAAKKLVYGDVALDLVAGPSELAILADDSADPACAAADLLSQAEHGTGWEKVLFVTTSSRMASAVLEEVRRQVKRLRRRQAVERVLEKGSLAVVVGSLAQGIDLCNRFGPEHLELMVRRPEQALRKIRCAGAVFLGKWSPESAGDFVAGPSHVLPTGGTAAMFSGLTSDDFRRRMSVIEFTRDDLKTALPVIEAFGRVEGLDAHAGSARIRFRKT